VLLHAAAATALLLISSFVGNAGYEYFERQGDDLRERRLD
jgi:hypothetical protein